MAHSRQIFTAHFHPLFTFNIQSLLCTCHCSAEKSRMHHLVSALSFLIPLFLQPQTLPECQQGRRDCAELRGTAQQKVLDIMR